MDVHSRVGKERRLRPSPLVVVVLLLLVAYLSIPQVVDANNAALSELDRLVSAETNVITFSNAKTYNKLVQAKPPRPFEMFVLFTASAKVGCVVCPEWNQAYFEVAQLAKQQLSANDTPVYFSVVKFDTASELFQLYKLQHAPLITYFPPDSSETYRFVPKNTLDLTRLDIVFPDPIAAFVSKSLGRSVEIVHSPWPRIGIIIGLLVFSVVAGKRFLLLVVPLLRWIKWPWFAFSVVLYGAGVSGIVYCYLTGVPWYYESDQTNDVQYFGDDQTQTVYEGIFIWMLLVLGGLALVGSASEPFAASSSLRMFNTLWNVLCLVCFVGAFHSYVSIYAKKTPWYAASLTDPLVKVWLSGAPDNHARMGW